MPAVANENKAVLSRSEHFAVVDAVRSLRSDIVRAEELREKYPDCTEAQAERIVSGLRATSDPERSAAEEEAELRRRILPEPVDLALRSDLHLSVAEAIERCDQQLIEDGAAMEAEEASGNQPRDEDDAAEDDAELDFRRLNLKDDEDKEGEGGAEQKS